jgi:ketosteroid isomerase-like protein
MGSYTLVTYVGPRHKSVLVGWDTQKKYWPEANALFTQRNVTLSDQHIHVNGNLAWEMGQETGEQNMKDGSSPKLDYLVTNVYEKIDGHWFIVSHHVQPKPQYANQVIADTTTQIADPGYDADSSRVSPHLCPAAHEVGRCRVYATTGRMKSNRGLARVG